MKTQEILMSSFPITGIVTHVMVENVDNRNTCLTVSEFYKKCYDNASVEGQTKNLHTFWD